VTGARPPGTTLSITIQLEKEEAIHKQNSRPAFSRAAPVSTANRGSFVASSEGLSKGVGDARIVADKAKRETLWRSFIFREYQTMLHRIEM
jgi:hypothetical protein